MLKRIDKGYGKEPDIKNNGLQIKRKRLRRMSSAFDAI